VTLALVLTALALAQAGQATSWAVDPAASRVTFGIRHKLHAVDGVAREVEGRAIVAADGKVQAMVRIPVASLDTDEANRDEDMREVLEARKFPFVVLRGIGTLPMPPPRGAPVRLELAGELEVHGVRRPLTAPVEVVFADDGSARVKGAFQISLDEYRIERPSLLLVRIDDACKVAFDLVVREEKK
jgi:polyisoprenoid-binding protein YceI